jgi:hypothetical protein
MVKITAKPASQRSVKNSWCWIIPFKTLSNVCPVSPPLQDRADPLQDSGSCISKTIFRFRCNVKARNHVNKEETRLLSVS